MPRQAGARAARLPEVMNSSRRLGAWRHAAMQPLSMSVVGCKTRLVREPLAQEAAACSLSVAAASARLLPQPPLRLQGQTQRVASPIAYGIGP